MLCIRSVATYEISTEKNTLMMKIRYLGTNKVFLWFHLIKTSRGLQSSRLIPTSCPWLSHSSAALLFCPLSELLHFTYFPLLGLFTLWKSLLKVSSAPLNKPFVGGFPCSHCGFRTVGCHFHLLFHHVGVAKPPETLPAGGSYADRLLPLETQLMLWFFLFFYCGEVT